MKLYGDTLSPFVRSTLVVAHEAGLAAKLEHLKEAVNPTQVNARLSALSPIAKVPVLETDHGKAVYDSRVIVEYLCHVAGNSTLIPDDGVKRFRVLTLQALAQGLGDCAVGYRYETAARPKGLQWADWIERTTKRFAAIFDELEANWIACLSEVNVGSITTAVVLTYMSYRMPEIDWRDGRPKLAAFHAEFAKRPSMVATEIGK